MATIDIGKYKNLERIGRGAMGVVYRGRHPYLDKPIAIKLMAADLDADPELRDRFFREAQVAYALHHENIVKVHDLAEDDGRAYIVMEFLDGESLKEVLDTSAPLTLEEKLELMIDVSDALAYAHSREVVHRDIKPANIQITSSGMPKILDFGLARIVDSEMTATGMVMGTPSYMSPEQVDGKKVDGRSDIFSLGAVFYELLTYRRAFEGKNFTQIFMKIARDDPDPVNIANPAIPEELSGIIQRCLVKDRDARYATMDEMLRDLRRFSDGLPELKETLRGQAQEGIERLGELRGSHPDILGSAAAIDQTVVLSGAADQTIQVEPSVLEGGELPEDFLGLKNAVLHAEEAYERSRKMVEELAWLADLPLADLDAASDEWIQGTLEKIDAALESFPGQPRCREIRSLLKEEVERRAEVARRHEHLRSLLERAESLAAERSFEEAIRTVDEALGIEPGDETAAALRQRLVEQLEEQRARDKAAAEAGAKLDEARQALEAEDPAAARTAVQRASEIFPDIEGVDELLRQADQLEAELEERRRQEEEGRRRREEERKRQEEERERREQVAAAISSAEKALQGRDPAAVRKHAGTALELDPGNEDATALLAGADELEARLHAEKQASASLDDARQALQAEDPGAARAAAQKARETFPDVEGVDEVLQQADALEAELEERHRKEEERRRKEEQRRREEEEARGREEEERRRQEQVAAAIASAKEALGGRDPAAVRKHAEVALELDPGNDDATALLAGADELEARLQAQAQATAELEGARQALRAEDPAAARAAAQRARETFPDVEGVDEVLQQADALGAELEERRQKEEEERRRREEERQLEEVARERRAQFDSWLRDAAASLEAGNLDRARSLAEKVLAEEADHPEAAALLAEVDAKSAVVAEETLVIDDGQSVRARIEEMATTGRAPDTADPATAAAPPAAEEVEETKPRAPRPAPARQAARAREEAAPVAAIPGALIDKLRDNWPYAAGGAAGLLLLVVLFIAAPFGSSEPGVGETGVTSGDTGTEAGPVGPGGGGETGEQPGDAGTQTDTGGGETGETAGNVGTQAGTGDTGGGRAGGGTETGGGGTGGRAGGGTETGGGATDAGGLVAEARQHFNNQSYSQALASAQAALKIDAGNADARSLADRANQRLAAIRDGLVEAQDHLDAGRSAEAVAAAEAVLNISRGHADASRIRGAGLVALEREADEARGTMESAKAAADEAEAPRRAAAAYRAAQQVENEARAFLDGEDYPAARDKFREAAREYGFAEREADRISGEASARSAATSSRQAYLDTRSDAEAANADELAPDTFQRAADLGNEAQRKLDQGDFDGARQDFDAAAGAMSAAMSEAAAVTARGAITAVVGEFEAAFGRRDIEAIKRLWPDLPQELEERWQNLFGDADTIEFSLQPTGAPTVQGDTATAGYLQNQRFTMDRQQGDVTLDTTFYLRRQGGVWRIARWETRVIR